VLSLYHAWLQLKGLWIFGRRVGIIGNFTVAHPRNVKIGKRCGINRDVFILGHNRIDIGDNVVLSVRVMLIDAGLELENFANVNFPAHTDGYIVIEDGVWIGAGAIILPNVTIGRKSVVGAGSVVTKDVPAGSIVAGSPARVIGRTDR
jgi:maltose O-acetyltransferase